MRTYNVHVDFISEDGAVLYSRTFPIIAESALMAETWVANILAVLEYQNFRFRETREASQLPPTKVGGLQKRASVTSKP